MAKKTQKQRAAEQVGRQRDVRKQATKARKPSRDDIARIALWRFINTTWRIEANPRALLDEMRNTIVADLEEQGFDERESEARWDELEEKYRRDLKPFRIKRHLLARNDSEPDV